MENENIDEAKLQKNRIDKANYIKICIDRWKATPFLEGMNETEQTVAAMVLDAQMLYKDQQILNHKLQDKIYLIIQKVFTDFLPLNLISMQPMMGPVDTVDYLKFVYCSNQPKKEEDKPDELSDPFVEDLVDENTPVPTIELKIESAECVAKTRKLKVNFLTNETFERENWVDEVAKELRNDLTQEILKDLRNNAGTVATWDFSKAGSSFKEQFESLYVKIVGISCILRRKTLRGGVTWIVAGSDLAHLLQNGIYVGNKKLAHPKEYYESLPEPIFLGNICSAWKIWIDPNMPKNEMLLGYKGNSSDSKTNNLDAGYFYNPYIFLSSSPVSLSQEEFKPTWGLLSRYSKKLLISGAKYYARLTVENL